MTCCNIVRDSGAAVIVADEARMSQAAAPTEERAIETDLAYILYMPGSTGTPKGG